MFIEYPYGKKGCHLSDLEKKEFFVSRDVLLCESKFPYCEVNKSGINQEISKKQSMWKFLKIKHRGGFSSNLIFVEKEEDRRKGAMKNYGFEQCMYDYSMFHFDKDGVR